MDEARYVVCDYSFSNESDYRMAKKEMETIEYIRASTNLEDSHKVLKLYQSFIKKRRFITIVGYDFLKELRLFLLKSGIIQEDELAFVHVIGKKPPSSVKEYVEYKKEDQEIKHQNLIEDYRSRYKNAKIINLFLAITIIIMIVISIRSDRTVFKNFEEDIIDKYATWQEELEERERRLEINEKQ